MANVNYRRTSRRLTLEGKIKHALDGVKVQLAEVKETLMREISDLRETNKELCATNEELHTKNTVLEKAVANTESRPRDVPELKIPKPKPFNGARDVKVLENFIWQMEQYFKASKTRMKHKGLIQVSCTSPMARCSGGGDAIRT